MFSSGNVCPSLHDAIVTEARAEDLEGTGKGSSKKGVHADARQKCLQARQIPPDDKTGKDGSPEIHYLPQEKEMWEDQS